MATATVRGTYLRDGYAFMHAEVAEGGARGNVEYVGRCLYDADFQALTGAQQKAALVAAVKAVRDAQVTAAPAAPTITGSVTV